MDRSGPHGLGYTDISVVEDRVEVLKRLRARLAEEIDSGPCSRDLVLLTGRLQSVMDELDNLGAGDGVCAADQIAARRAERLKQARQRAARKAQ